MTNDIQKLFIYLFLILIIIIIIQHLNFYLIIPNISNDRNKALNAGMYTPGMMTDVVREVKEAARVREEALLSRVRSMVEERSWTMNEIHLKMIRDLEELKVNK